MDETKNRPYMVDAKKNPALKAGEMDKGKRRNGQRKADKCMKEKTKEKRNWEKSRFFAKKFAYVKKKQYFCGLKR